MIQAGMCIDGYTLLSRMGGHGASEVWKARTPSGHIAVIKTASPSLLNDLSRVHLQPADRLRISASRSGTARSEGGWSTVCSYSGLFCFLPLWPLLGARPAFTIALLLQTVSACGTFLALVYVGWRAIDDGLSLLRPREAALLLLVPLWNLLWAAQAVARFGAECNRFAVRHNLEPLANSRIYVWMYCALVGTFVAELVSFITFPRLLSGLLMLQILVLVPVLTWMLSLAAAWEPSSGRDRSSRRTEPVR